MKIAVTGKGGVGKTTLAGLLARLLAQKGHSVLAVDADPDANLASALGIGEAKLKFIEPIARMKELAEERTGAAEGYGGFFSLNPKVSDIPERFAIDHHGVRLLVLGTVEQGGAGCICPEHALLKTLMKHILFREKDAVVMDMEAGVEHLGRGTAESVDALVVVVEPGARSLQTAAQIRKLAAGIGLERVFVVGSKVGNLGEERFLRSKFPKADFLGILPLSDDVRQADMQGVAPFDAGGTIVESARSVLAALEGRILQLG